jgi:hypothetical protein
VSSVFWAPEKLQHQQHIAHVYQTKFVQWS